MVFKLFRYTNIDATFNYVVATHRLHLAPLWPVRVSDDEVGDGRTFGDKQQLRVVNYILLELNTETCLCGTVLPEVTSTPHHPSSPYLI